MDDELMDYRTTKYKTKDSVFSCLFGDPKNILELYKELHPEDTDVTVDDIQIETLETVLVNDIYNDLGFIIKDGEKSKYILLVEAQSKWTENISLRMLFYITETYRRYLRETNQSEHICSKVELPKPEFYVVYMGGKNVSDEVSLNQTYFGGEAPLDIRVRVLKRTNAATIYGQYINFSKVYDEQRKIYRNTIECIRETIRICLEKGYLVDFLNTHKKEVYSMLSELFDEQALRERYDVALIAKSRSEGEVKGVMKTLIDLVKKGILTVPQAADQANLTVEEFEAKTGLKTT